MRNILPYEVGTTDEPGKYIVWGRGIGGKVYRTYVLDPSGLSILNTLSATENIKRLAIDNDDWTFFDDLYHGGKSPNPHGSLARDFEELQDTTNLSNLVDKYGLVKVIDKLNDYCKSKEEDSKLDDQEPSARKWWCARVHIEQCSNLVEMIGL
jgi:hypothetical protein